MSLSIYIWLIYRQFVSKNYALRDVFLFTSSWFMQSFTPFLLYLSTSIQLYFMLKWFLPLAMRRRIAEAQRDLEEDDQDVPEISRFPTKLYIQSWNIKIFHVSEH